jgi:SAM-dependent MidA family methyltransferase
MTRGVALPPLTADEQAHAARVRSALIHRIEGQGGWIAFSDFMRFALYEPGLGYYSAGARKFGAAGDFITAPELSPLFARCIARQVAEVFERTGGREIVEFGAGTGALACDLVQGLVERGLEPQRYAIVEVSADLRERQRERVQGSLGALAGRVEWLDRPPAAPMRGVVLANEVLDAFPVERFRLACGRVERLGVALAGEDLAITARPAPPQIEAAVRALAIESGENYESEFCPQLPAWIAAAAAPLAQGVLLIMDYGLPRAQYYHADRSHGTLLCHFRQRAHSDPLMRVGLQDITAWVDFTAVAEAADAARLDVLGFTTQAHFLLATGLGSEFEPNASHRQAAQRLLLPGEMGEAFKAMALGRGVEEPLIGFGLRDLRHTL